MTRTMYDAAYPPPDPRLQVCAFYIGVPGNTPHVWGDAEIAGQSARWRLPIVTRVNAQGAAQANADADAAVSWMRGHRVPAGCAVALDFEAQVNGVYVTAFDKRVTAGGYRVLLYGQASTVYHNPRPSAGYWSGQWTGTAHLDPRDSATQWAGDQQLAKPYDLSQVSDGLTLWDTRAATLVRPAPIPILKEEDMLVVQCDADPAHGFGGGIWLLAGGVLSNITQAGEVAAFKAAGVGLVVVSYGTYQNILASSNALIAAGKLTGALSLSLTGSGSLTAQ